MQAGGQTGIRLAAGLADEAVFIHHQSFRTGVGGISRGIVRNQGHDDKGGFSRLACLFFQFAVVGFRIRKISGLAKCRTLVYFAHHGRKVPGAVLNDKEGPLAHQALVHTGQQRQYKQNDEGYVAAGDAFKTLDAAPGDRRWMEPPGAFQHEPETEASHDQHANPAEPQEFPLRRQKAAVVLVRTDDVEHAHFP